MSRVGFFEKMFNKTVMLRPTAEGVLEPLDITGQDEVFLNQVDMGGRSRAIEIKPKLIYQVRGVKGLKRLCIHQYNSTQLLDLYHEPQNPALSEKMLADLLDISYQKGLKEGAGASSMNQELGKTLKLIMILSGIAALVAVVTYLGIGK